MQLDEDVEGQKKEGRYLLGVGAVPVDAVPLRGEQPGARAHDQSRNPNQIHGGSEETRRARGISQTAQTRAQRQKKKTKKEEKKS